MRQGGAEGLRRDGGQDVLLLQKPGTESISYDFLLFKPSFELDFMRSMGNKRAMAL